MRPLLEVLRRLDEADVRAVVVGGVAVVLHGHPRLTADLDLVVDLEPTNLHAALAVFEQLGLVPRLPVPASQFADPAVREAWRQERGLTVFSFHDPTDPRREVDVFAAPPVDFDDLWEDRHTVQVEGVAIAVASRAHLIAMKRDAGRPQDLADIAALEALPAPDNDHG